MTFHVGQRVVCVDASLPANPWHRQHPLVLKRIYVVQHCFVECIDIDGSRRGWQNCRFRPVVEKKTDISVFTEILRRESDPRVMATSINERDSILKPNLIL